MNDAANSVEATTARPAQMATAVDPALIDRLMVRVAAGDRASFEALYDLLAPHLYRLARLLTVEDQAAEQVSTEAFATIWRTARSCPAGGSAALRWAASITCLQVAAGWHRTPDHRARTGPDDVTAGAGRATREGLQTLTAAQRASIALATGGGFTYRQIGDLMDRPARTVAALHRDALIRFRDTVATVDRRQTRRA